MTAHPTPADLARWQRIAESSLDGSREPFVGRLVARRDLAKACLALLRLVETQREALIACAIPLEVLHGVERGGIALCQDVQDGIAEAVAKVRAALLAPAPGGEK